jgi:hypothetical protein
VYRPSVDVLPSTTTSRWSDPRFPLATRQHPAAFVVPVFTPS